MKVWDLYWNRCQKNRNRLRIATLSLVMALVLGSFTGCSNPKDPTKGAAGEVGKTEGTQGSKEGGAGNDEDGEVAMGRFLEEDVELPVVFGDIFDMKKLEDGTIRIAGSNADNGVIGVWESKDKGASWEAVYDLPKEIQDSEQGYTDDGALFPDGKLVCVFNEITDGGIKPVLYLLDQEGNGKRVPFELPSEKDGGGASDSFSTRQDVGSQSGEEHATNSQSGDIQVSEGQLGGSQEGEGQPEGSSQEGEDASGQEGRSNLCTDIICLGNDQALVQDIYDTIYQVGISDGSVKQKYEFEGNYDSHHAYAIGNKMLVLSSSEVLAYDLETGEQLASEEMLQGSLAENGNITAMDTINEGESLYYLTMKGLYHYKFGGSVLEQLIDGDMNSLGAPAFYPITLAAVDEQEFLVAANDPYVNEAGGIALLRYTYSADTPAKPDKEIKVYSLYDNRELGQSISRFQKENTDIYLNYQVALSEENGVTVSDALKTLTTEIMAGKGPDVLVLDGMPVETYIEKGILRDLSSLFTEGKESYFEHIINSYQDGQGQMFAVPARFLIPMAQGSGSYYSPEDDFDTFTSRKDTMVNMEPSEVVEMFWYTCGAAWKKEDGTFDAAKVTDFLTKLKQAYGEYGASLDDVNIGMAIGDGRGVVEELRKISFEGGLYGLASKRHNTCLGMSGRWDYGMMQGVARRIKDLDYGLLPGQAEHVFVPAMILGVSSKSSQPETAEQFVKHLFSKDAQKISQSGGYPVEREAFRSVVDGHQFEGKENLVAVTAMEEGDESGELFDYAMEPTPEAEIKKLTDLVESLKTPALRDDVIKEAVIEQGEKVLKGEIRPEEATDAIMQKVNIYLAE